MPGVLDDCHVLAEMYSAGVATNESGESAPIVANLFVEDAESLDKLVLETRTKLVIELGMRSAHPHSPRSQPGARRTMVDDSSRWTRSRPRRGERAQMASVLTTSGTQRRMYTGAGS